MNLSPRQRFLASSAAAAHHQWANSEVARAACEATLSEMALGLKGENLKQLEGAAHFANLLMNMAEPERKKSAPSSNTLRYGNPPTQPQPTQ